MTTGEINLAMAKVAGWKKVNYYWESPNGKHIWDLPFFAIDMNAVRDVWCEMSISVQLKCGSYLYGILCTTRFIYIEPKISRVMAFVATATPLEHCEAILRAHGVWKE